MVIFTFSTFLKIEKNNSYYKLLLQLGVNMDPMNSIYKTTISGELYFTLGQGSAYLGKCVVQIHKCGKQGFIKHLFVKEQHRGKGLGQQILKFVEEDLKKVGCTEVILNAKEESDKYGKLERYYTNMGYQKVPKERFIDVDGFYFRVLPMIKHF